VIECVLRFRKGNVTGETLVVSLMQQVVEEAVVIHAEAEAEVVMEVHMEKEGVMAADGIRAYAFSSRMGRICPSHFDPESIQDISKNVLFTGPSFKDDPNFIKLYHWSDIHVSLIEPNIFP